MFGFKLRLHNLLRSGKSIKYWEEKFISSSNRWSSEDRKNMIDQLDVSNDWFEFNAACDLLLEYSSTDYNPKFKPAIDGGGTWSGFWSGRWKTNHRDAVRDTLVALFDKPKSDHTIIMLLTTLKEKLGNVKLNPEGDLNKILIVIKEKTGIDFEEIQASTVASKFTS